MAASPRLTLWQVLLFIVLGLVSLVPVTSAANTIKFVNHCTYPMYVWMQVPFIQAHDDEAIYVPPYGGSAVHNMVSTQVSLKLRDLPNFEHGGVGIIQAEYNRASDPVKTFYDLSVIDCDKLAGPESPYYCPFVAGGIVMYPSGSGDECHPAYCNLAQGQGRCIKSYLAPGMWGMEPTLNCLAGSDFFVETCVAGPGLQSFDPSLDAPDTPAQPWTDFYRSPLLENALETQQERFRNTPDEPFVPE
jgi:hypothetical protein